MSTSVKKTTVAVIAFIRGGYFMSDYLFGDYIIPHTSQFVKHFHKYFMEIMRVRPA